LRRVSDWEKDINGGRGGGDGRDDQVIVSKWVCTQTCVYEVHVCVFSAYVHAG